MMDIKNKEFIEKADLVLVNPIRSNKVGIFTLASYVRSKGYKVAIIDGMPRDIIIALGKLNSVKVLGFTALTCDMEFVNQLCKYAKDKFPDVLTILGGYHATAMPERTMEETDFDMLVTGEGEITLLKILEGYKTGDLKNIPGTVVRENNTIKINPSREYIKDLDEIPHPAYDLVNIEGYLHEIRHNKEIETNRTICLLVSRGCPFDCAFCSSKLMWNRQLRFFSVDWIISLLNKLVNEYNIDSISFLDDEFVVHPIKINEFCDRMIEGGLNKKIRWSCQTTVKTINRNPEILKKMKEAGCVLVRFGIESGSDESLSYLKNNLTTVQENYDAIKLCKKDGINTFGSLILGAPEENIDNILQTIKFIETSGINYVDVFVLTPLPETQAWHDYKRLGYLDEKYAWKYVFLDPEGMNKEPTPIIRNKHFTSEQLYNIRNYIQRNICEPITLGKKVEILDHRKEIEKILNGEISLCKQRPDITLFYKKERLLRKVKTAVNNPMKVVKFIKNRFEWEMKYAKESVA